MPESSDLGAPSHDLQKVVTEWRGTAVNSIHGITHPLALPAVPESRKAILPGGSAVFANLLQNKACHSGMRPDSEEETNPVAPSRSSAELTMHGQSQTSSPERELRLPPANAGSAGKVSLRIGSSTSISMVTTAAAADFDNTSSTQQSSKHSHVNCPSAVAFIQRQQGKAHRTESHRVAQSEFLRK